MNPNGNKGVQHAEYWDYILNLCPRSVCGTQSKSAESG